MQSTKKEKKPYKISSKSRSHIEISLGAHRIWMVKLPRAPIQNVGHIYTTVTSNVAISFLKRFEFNDIRCVNIALQIPKN